MELGLADASGRGFAGAVQASMQRTGPADARQFTAKSGAGAMSANRGIAGCEFVSRGEAG
jgi:hypothetical protein